MIDTAALKAANAKRWKAAHPTRSFDSVVKRIMPNKDRYKAIEKTTGVPWFVIATIHYRESNLDFGTNLAQGDPWDQVSRHVPAGRGPFSSFEAAAHDALVNCAPHAAQNTDWTAGGSLTLLEKYNGLGYANKGVPSPYVWSGTDQYSHGKYVADGVYDDTAVDKQLGCAGLIKSMSAQDSSVRFSDEKPVITPGTAAGGSVGLLAVLAGLFHDHPQIIAIAAGSLAAGVLTALIIKLIRKRKDKKNVIPQEPLVEDQSPIHVAEQDQKPV